MCLIVFAYKVHPSYRLVVVANRDEVLDRPSRPAQFWPEEPSLLAGKDLQAGGTWLGYTHTGRFAALTNYRDPANIRSDVRSRGELPYRFLSDNITAQEYLEWVDKTNNKYNGFNLLVGDQNGLWYYSNIEKKTRELAPGIYGLSNHLLDTPWPKVTMAKQGLASKLNNNNISSDDLLSLMRNSSLATDEELPKTGVPYEWEKALSAMFIRKGNYGTYCSTLLLAGQNGNYFEERRYALDGSEAGRSIYQW